MKKGMFLLMTLLLVTAFAQSASAFMMDFEDLAPASTITVGAGEFYTGGVSITGETYQLPIGGGPFDGGVATVSSGMAAGAGNEILCSMINLRFNLIKPVMGLSLMFGNSGRNINIEINQEQHNVVSPADLPMLIGGTQVFVINGMAGPAAAGMPLGEGGAIFVMGNITSFSIGGDNLAIDNVIASCVPEPATMALLGIGGCLAFVRNRRRNS